MDIAALRAVPFLRELTDEELSSFAALLTDREYKQGDRILEEGATPAGFYIVSEGVVHVRRRANAREMLLARIGPGGFFGEINLFDPGAATASIYAMKKTRLAFIPYPRFHVFMDQNPRAGLKITRALLAEVSRRMRLVSARLVNSVFWSEAPRPLSTPA